MAWKTPGVYFTEIYNTDFTNPAASISTTVAIIGFAKKGPIGVPVEIKTYNDYKSIFGTPIAGQYAGLAVRSVLSAGGIVLYTRIADETIASKSKVILKNGSKATDGAVIINKATDITVGTDGYELGKTYAGKIADANGDEKTLIIRTPSEGKLKLSNMVKQFKESLAANYGREEFSVPNKIPYTSVRNFNVSVFNNESSEEDKKPFGPYFVNVKGTDFSSGKVSNLVSNIQSALEKGPNAYQKIYIFGGNGKGIITDENGDMSTAKFEVGKNEKINFQFKYTIGKNGTELVKRIEVSSVQYVDDTRCVYIKDIVEALNDKFESEGIYVKWCYNNEESGMIVDGTYGYLLFVSLKGDEEFNIRPAFNSKGNIIENSLFIPVEPLEDDKPHYYDGETSIDPAYSEKVKFAEQNSGKLFEDVSYFYKDGTWKSEDYSDNEPYKGIVTNKSEDGYVTPENYVDNYDPEVQDSEHTPFEYGDNNKLQLNEVVKYEHYETNEETQETVLVEYKFYKFVVGSDNRYTFEPVMKKYGQDINKFSGLFVSKQKSVKNTAKQVVDVKYDDNVNSLIFTVSSEAFDNPEGTQVVVSRTEFGSYLFNDRNITAENPLSADNKKAIGDLSASVAGEKALPLSVFLEENQIHFTEEGNIIPGTMDTTTVIGAVEGVDGSGYLPLSNLVGELKTEDEFIEGGYTNAYKCIRYKEGSAELDPSKRDIVVFTAREYGEGTNVGVRIYTSTSPIDGTKTHYIETVVGGIVKETWEDVSYNPADERYFKNLINEEPENAGSAYIKVDVVKNDTATEEIMLPDTADITGSDTPIYVGKPVNENSINRADTEGKTLDGTPTGKPVAESDYMSYDYMVGDNGVPDDSADLFMEAMDTEKSGLCNKDLYYWHILITPDNISEEVQDCAIKFCEFMDDAIYIADPPQGISRENVVKWHNGAFGRSSALQSDFACTYWPWLKVFDSNESKYVWCMPSVLMAAQFCKVDNNYEPWYAPAGETNGLISQAVDLETYPNKADRDVMYLDQNRVNPFLMMKNGNILAYGEKTLKRKNSVLTKIHTRRMLISLKHQLRNSIKGFIFMPTMAETISKIRGIATSIMEAAKTGGGVSSYRVVCDESNNTTETLQQDILNISVFCVPNGCLEQIEITFTLDKNAS